MILTKKLKIEIVGFNFKYWKNKGYNIPLYKDIYGVIMS